MRVALFDYSLFYESLGLANLMGVLKTYGQEYKLFIISEDQDILENVKKFKPDLLCFSTSTGTHHISFRLARYLKKHMDTKTLFGGPHVTLFPDECIKEGCLDMLCRGEGEEVLIELLDALEKKSDYTRIKNLWVKKNGTVYRNESRVLIQDLDSLPLPDRSPYLQYPILRDFPLKRFITGYGCPFQCSFCHNVMFAKEAYRGKGNYLRKKSVNRTFREIRDVQEISVVKRVHFHDDNFNFHKEWFREFCSRYPQEIGIPWSCTVRVDMLDDATVKMMRDSGCVGVTYGLETYNERVRNKILNKKLKNSDFEKAAQLFKKYKLRHIATNMLNLPGETVEDALKTLRYARKLDVHNTRTAVYCVIKKQPIIQWLIENKYLLQSPEIDNFNPLELKDFAIRSPELEKLIRLSAVFNIMLKFPFLEPVFRVFACLPIDKLFRHRIYDGYLEMKFMDVPVLQGFHYYLRIKKGLNAYQSLR